MSKKIKPVAVTITMSNGHNIELIVFNDGHGEWLEDKENNVFPSIGDAIMHYNENHDN